jgi:putative transposase
MKRSRFTEAQIAFILRQAEEGTAVGEVCRKAGISEATYYNWRKKYAGLMPSEMKRLRQLEEENSKLKKSSPTWLSTVRCCRTSSAESFEACPEAPTGGSCADNLAGEHSTCLPCAAGRSLDLPLSLPSGRAGSTLRTHQRDRRNPRTLRLSAHPLAAAS